MPTYQQKQMELMQLRNQVSRMSENINAKAKNLSEKEGMLRQSQIPLGNARDLEKNLARNFGPMAPANVGDINKIIWPFYFSTEVPSAPIAVNETLQTGFSVTQEAAFIMMSFTKAVYVEDGGVWNYLDPNTPDLIDQAPGLVFTIRDGSSSRQFYNAPMEISNYGNPRFPTTLPRPIMFLPNQIVQIQFTNTNPSESYVPMVTVFGYRCRIEDAQNILSLIYS